MSLIFRKSNNLRNCWILWNHQQSRNLSLLEHASYSLLNCYQIPTPRYGVAKSPDEAFQIAELIKTDDMVVKAQVLAGGRGAGTFTSGLKGGVHLAQTPDQVRKLAEQMIGQTLVTKQTGPKGKICNTIMITERKYTRKEYYLGIMMDRTSGGPLLLASSRGGVNIEEVAATNPEAIIMEKINYDEGLTTEQVMKVVNAIGIKCNIDQTIKVLQNMYCMFIHKDALLVEINPYGEDVCECFYALDAKMNFDDNAEFRQEELFALRDKSQEDPKEVAASEADLSYIPLDGTIGCMVNGAGLAMATMDLITLHGGEPANFLDFAGEITTNKVEEAFKIVTSDEKVKVIYLNVFGGIARCDEVVKGIIQVAQKMDLKIPVVVRLMGTNIKEAQELIMKSKLGIISFDDFSGSAELAVKISPIVELAHASNLDVTLQLQEKCNKPVCQAPSSKPEKQETTCPENQPTIKEELFMPVLEESPPKADNKDKDKKC